MKHAVNFDDRADVADWLANLMDRATDLVDIATEATKPRRERTLCKAALRRELQATFGELHKLCRAGRRGIRAPRRTP
jgi:hypothetical protein